MLSSPYKPVLENLKTFLPASIRTFLRNYVFSKHCRVALPWFKIIGNNDDINIIHRFSFEIENGNKQEFSKVLFCSFSWPIFVCIVSLFYTMQKGSRINKRYDVGVISQLSKMIYLGIFYNITSDSFYKFRLFEKDALRKTGSYVQHHEIILILPRINRGIDSDTIDDKALFYQFCSERRIPTAPVFVSFDESGRESWFCGQDKLPSIDLIVKPTNLHCGLGVHRWMYHSDTAQWRSNGRSLSQPDLLKSFSDHPDQLPLLVQPALENHPSLRDFSTGGLCTLRVVTFRKPGDEPSYVLACFRMPVGDQVADNFAAGGIAARLTGDGHLGKAFSKDPCIGTFTHHPTTKLPIEGRCLPRWREMIDLAIAAHRHFAGLGAIGWDIGLIESGPILLEGNAVWCVELAQIPGNVPLKEVMTPEVLSEIERVAASKI